jgi:hypothetical protein
MRAQRVDIMRPQLQRRNVQNLLTYEQHQLANGAVDDLPAQIRVEGDR